MFRFFLFLILYLCFSIDVSAGGPWTLAKQKAYVQFSYNIIAKNNRLFSTENKDNSLFLSRAITDQTISLYAEYGLTDKFTLIAYAPFKLVKNGSEILLPDDPYQSIQGSLSAFGNIQLTGKYQFYNKKYLLAGELSLSLPTGKTYKAARLSTGYQTYGIQPGLHIGYAKDKFYTFGTIAYNFRTSLIDEYKIGYEIGYKLYKGIYTIVAIDILQSIKEQQARTDDFSFLYQEQQEYIASTLKLSKKVYKNMGVNLHMTILTIHANYVQKGPAMGGSFYWKF